MAVRLEVLLKEPSPEVDHVAEEAPPPKDPLVVYVELEQMVAVAGPALTVAGSPITTTTGSESGLSQYVSATPYDLTLYVPLSFTAFRVIVEPVAPPIVAPFLYH